MAAVRGKDTKPELIIRRGLHRLGFRYRLQAKDLPGKPDLVLPRHGAVIFVHGCFWHGHDCPLFRLPATRTEFWRGKIASNVLRDRKNLDALHRKNWRVAVVWECACRGGGPEKAGRVLTDLSAWICSPELFAEFSAAGTDSGRAPSLGLDNGQESRP